MYGDIHGEGHIDSDKVGGGGAWEHLDKVTVCIHV